MLRTLICTLTLMSLSLFLLSDSESVGWDQPSVKTEAAKNDQPQIITKIGDYILTVRDLDQLIKGYPEGTVSSREAKLRVVESMISAKLFALAAREAKFDATEDFPKAKQKARENALIYAYLQRFLQPKFTEEAARRYFAEHPEEYKNFGYSRNRIIDLLRDKALIESNESLKKEWGVKRNDDVLKDLDLKSAKDPSVVLAQIGPAIVTIADLKELVSLYPRMPMSTFEARKDAVELLVLDRLYVQAAEKAGLTNDPQVQRALGTAEDQVLAVRYAQFVEQKITLDDAQRYYQAHPEEFRRPDQLWLRQIVVATPENAQLVKDTLGRGQSFEEVAKAFSTDKNSAANGGDIGWVRKGRLHPEVEKVAFRLKPKQVSEPIKTPGGYYIIRLEERLDGTMKPFDEIASNLLLRLKSVAVDAERKRLMTTYKVAINQELL